MDAPIEELEKLADQIMSLSSEESDRAEAIVRGRYGRRMISGARMRCADRVYSLALDIKASLPAILERLKAAEQTLEEARLSEAELEQACKDLDLLVEFRDERIKALEEALTQMVDEKADYMRLNNLGDPEAQHTIKAARQALEPEQ